MPFLCGFYVEISETLRGNVFYIFWVKKEFGRLLVKLLVELVLEESVPCENLNILSFG